jgi:Flp pilus assembly protein TadB
MSVLYSTGTGQKIVAVGLLMIAIGSALLRKIVSFRG